MRHGLVGALRAVHPAAEANVLRTAALLREETELLDGLVADALAGRESIAIARLQRLPAALARLVVVRLAEDAAGAYVPQAGDRVEEILALAPPRRRAELHVGGQRGRGDRARRARDAQAPAARGLDSRTWPPPRASQPSP